MKLIQRIRHRLSLMTLDPIARAVVKDRLTYLSIEKLVRLQQALQETKEVEGDILEFGVALGGSGIILAQHAATSRRFLGFDVFGMIPPPASEKDDAKSKDRYETISSGRSEGIGGDKYYGYKKDLLTEVKASFSRHHVPVDGQKVLLYKGLFQEVWPTVAVDRISLVHIDCDWYDPVKFCLFACANKLNHGGIIVIDDYHDYGGCRTAVNEFLAERHDFKVEYGSNPFLKKT